MKNFILIAVLAALTVCNNAASIPTEVANENHVYQQGEAGVGNVLLFKTEIRLDPIPNTVQTKVIEYRADANTRVTHLSIFEPGLNQGGSTHVNGFGTNHVTVTMTSVLGRGFYYIIEMWGPRAQ